MLVGPGQARARGGGGGGRAAPVGRCPEWGGVRRLCVCVGGGSTQAGQRRLLGAPELCPAAHAGRTGAKFGLHHSRQAGCRAHRHRSCRLEHLQPAPAGQAGDAAEHPAGLALQPVVVALLGGKDAGGCVATMLAIGRRGGPAQGSSSGRAAAGVCLDPGRVGSAGCGLLSEAGAAACRPGSTGPGHRGEAWQCVRSHAQRDARRDRRARAAAGSAPMPPQMPMMTGSTESNGSRG